MVCVRDDYEEADFYFSTTGEARTIASDQQRRLGRAGSASEDARLARSPDRSGTMTDTFLLCFALVAVTAACAVAARRLRVPYSIVLVITGIALAFVPGLPKVELDPQVVMLLFRPPLLYMAGVSMSWRGFRDNLRPIALLAVGCVLFTACAVAAVAHWAIGLPWDVAFVLGAVVSPPDVLAPMAIARRLQVPKRILTILEGEGLVNDATALILFRFAVAAVVHVADGNEI